MASNERMRPKLRVIEGGRDKPELLQETSESLEIIKLASGVRLLTSLGQIEDGVPCATFDLDQKTFKISAYPGQRKISWEIEVQEFDAKGHEVRTYYSYYRESRNFKKMIDTEDSIKDFAQNLRSFDKEAHQSGIADVFIDDFDEEEEGEIVEVREIENLNKIIADVIQDKIPLKDPL